MKNIPLMIIQMLLGIALVWAGGYGQGKKDAAEEVTSALYGKKLIEVNGKTYKLKVEEVK